MKSSDIKKAIKTCYSAKRPFMIWGPPGIGKSAVIKQAANEIEVEHHSQTGKSKITKQVAKEIGIELIDVRATLLDPVDLRGLPSPDGGKVKWLIPSFLPTEGQGILLLDELNSAPPATQAACYQLILDRALGEYTLPEGWLVCAAGNREIDRGVTHRMPSPLANRLIHFYFDVDLNDWVSWALDAKILTEIIAFIRFRQDLLHSFDPKSNEKTFPTPRTWEFTHDLLQQQPPREIEFELISGTVGEGAATEFLAFLKIFRTLPNADLILINPKNANVPTEPSTLYALCGVLARKVNEQNAGRFFTYANRLPDEFSVLLVLDGTRINPEIVNTREYIDWVQKHADVYN